MGYNVGDTIISRWDHVDSSGNAITGATFTVVKALKPNGSTFSPTITEIGGGVYQVSFTPATGEAGQWYLLVADTAQNPDRYYENEWDVDSRTTIGAATVGDGASRTAIRRRIGRLFGDMLLLTATGNGTTTTFVDAINLARDDAIMVGRQLYFSGGTATNLGLTRRVTDNVKSTTTLTFTPAAAHTTATNDVAEIWNTREIGATLAEVHENINYAIADVADLATTAAAYEPGAFDYDDPVVSLPDDWLFFGGVSWLDLTGVWHRIGPADYRIDKVNRTVELRNRPRSLANGMSLRLWGYTIPGDLDADTDVTSVNPEWLAYQAAAKLALAIAPRAIDPVQMERRAQYWQDLADQRRVLNSGRPSGVFIRLA